MLFLKFDISLVDFINKDRFVKFNFISALVLNILNIGLVYYNFSRFLVGQTESVVLHYNIYFGIDKIGDWQNIYYLPLIGFFIIVINLLLSYWLHFYDKLISYFFLFIALFCQIILNLATFFIVLVN